MSLPKRPERSQPIPNQPFDSPEISTIRGPYWDMPLGSGLEDDGQGSVQTTGSTPSEPSAYLYGSSGLVGLGSGLQLGPNGELEQGGGYIYCTPQYGNLPVTYPPYNCATEVNTTGVTDFTNAWKNCPIVEMPCISSESVTNFSSAWAFCDYLTSFPNIDTSAGENFYYSWLYSGLTNFPRLNTSKGSIFYGSWCGCYNLENFPELDLSNGIDFGYAWYNCQNLENFPPIDTSLGENFLDAWRYCYKLTSFPPLNFSSGLDFAEAWFECSSLVSFPSSVFDNCPATNFNNSWYGCALSQQSVDNILISLDAASQSDGTVGINGGTSAGPSFIGEAAIQSLVNKGWSVLTNTGPGFNCNTEVDTAGYIDLSFGWVECVSLESFPVIDTSSVVSFRYTWDNCQSLVSFPALNFGAGSLFERTWSNCLSLTSFPAALDFSSGTNFESAWYGCISLTSFPSNLFNNCHAVNFFDAWLNCALSQQSVDNILISINTAGQSNGTLGINGGTSSAPGPAGLAAKAALQARGWTVLTN